MGRKQRPTYAVVVADSRSPRDGRNIEDLGRYEPLHEPARVSLNEDRVLYWLEQGAQPSETVRSLLSRQGLLLALHMKRKGLSDEEIQSAKEAHRTQATEKAEGSIKLTPKARREHALEEERKLAKEREAEFARQRAAAEAKAKADAEAAKLKEAEERAKAAAEAKAQQEAANKATAEAEAGEKETPVKATASEKAEEPAKAETKTRQKGAKKAVAKTDAGEKAEAALVENPEGETTSEGK